jgi:leucyl-tRNA synthetase
MVLKDGVKMSKSVGNVVDPGSIIKKYGADTARVLILFGAPVERDLDWSDSGIEGAYRFLKRVYRLCTQPQDFVLKKDQSDALLKMTHKTIQAVTVDIERFSYNTAISRLMEYVNFMYQSGANKAALDALILLLAPIAPFTSEELWSLAGYKGSVHVHDWPSFDASLIVDTTVTIVMQVNGKVRDKIEVAKGLDQSAVEALAKQSDNMQKFIAGGVIIKTIFVADKLLNIVVKPV